MSSIGKDPNTSLPDELLNYILEFGTLSDVRDVSRVSKLWKKQVLNSEVLHEVARHYHIEIPKGDNVTFQLVKKVRKLCRRLKRLYPDVKVDARDSFHAFDAFRNNLLNASHNLTDKIFFGDLCQSSFFENRDETIEAIIALNVPLENFSVSGRELEQFYVSLLAFCSAKQFPILMEKMNISHEKLQLLLQFACVMGINLRTVTKLESYHEHYQDAQLTKLYHSNDGKRIFEETLKWFKNLIAAGLDLSEVHFSQVLPRPLLLFCKHDSNFLPILDYLLLQATNKTDFNYANPIWQRSLQFAITYRQNEILWVLLRYLEPSEETIKLARATKNSQVIELINSADKLRHERRKKEFETKENTQSSSTSTSTTTTIQSLDEVD